MLRTVRIVQDQRCVYGSSRSSQTLFVIAFDRARHKKNTSNTSWKLEGNIWKKIVIQKGDNKTPKHLIASKKPIPGSAAQQCATAAPVHKPAPVQQMKIQKEHGNLDKDINTNT